MGVFLLSFCTANSGGKGNTGEVGMPLIGDSMPLRSMVIAKRIFSFVVLGFLQLTGREKTGTPKNWKMDIY